MPLRSPLGSSSPAGFLLRRPFRSAALGLAGVFAMAAVSAFAQGGEGRPAGGANAPDPRRGGDIAQRWCATCHVVASDQTQATGEARPFGSIARQPGFDAAALALFLLDPHPRMPDMGLSRAEAADIAAYIKSLAPNKP